MLRTIGAAIAIVMLAFIVPAQAQMMEPAKTMDTAKGKTLVDGKGMTLYTFDKDAAGKSNCNGGCTANWPPLMAPAGAKSSGNWSVVTRDDKSTAWAYKGKPLYTFAKDGKPGDAAGDGIGGVWHIATP